MRAAVPGKGGRVGTGRPVLGAGHRTRPARPFVRLSGAARSRALLRTRRRRPGCAPAPAGPREGPPGETSTRASAAGTRSQAGIRPSVCPREVFSSGGLRLVSVSRLPGADGRIRTRRGEPSAGPPPPASRARTRGLALGTRAQVGPLCPAPSPTVLSVSPLLLPG